MRCCERWVCPQARAAHSTQHECLCIMHVGGSRISSYRHVERCTETHCTFHKQIHIHSIHQDIVC